MTQNRNICLAKSCQGKKSTYLHTLATYVHPKKSEKNPAFFFTFFWILKKIEIFLDIFLQKKKIKKSEFCYLASMEKNPEKKYKKY